MPSFTMPKWPGRREFFLSQIKIAVILAIAYVGNSFEPSYPRNDNHDPKMFWIVNGFLAVATIATWKRRETPPSRVGLLGRDQTEEWKGWMQWAFIFYHYYRVYYVYNEIRVFVSAYVWMTGFGNFLYFDKKGDYSLERVISMIIRINYFPLLLSTFLGISLDLYYVVPLHTCGFLMTMATCYVGTVLEKRLGLSYWKSRVGAIGLSLLAHVLFYETPAVDSLLYVSKEIHFRFQADKYSAWMGVLSGLLMGKASEYMQWAYGGESENRKARMGQLALGFGLIGTWYYCFGFITDKYTYNPIHPYVFILPVLGWLMIRNSSKWLTETHSTFLEFLGRNTLETYVLQFHVFMNHDVQHIPVVIPGADANGNIWIKTANMILCGVVFVTLAVFARKITVSTQTTVVELMKEIRNPTIHRTNSEISSSDEEEMKTLKLEDGLKGLSADSNAVNDEGRKDADSS